MRKIFTLCALFTLLINSPAKAVTIPGATYTIPFILPPFGVISTLAQMVNVLNANEIGGAIVINLSANETAPSGGYVLGSATLNPSVELLAGPNRITINGNGYTITAPTGVGNADGIFKIQGTDYVTIKNLNLVESSGNTTNATMMEWGFALLRFGANDGTQYCSIKNCNITLNKNNSTAASGVSPKGSTGVFVGSCSATSTALLGPSLLTGATIENNYIAFDTIKNVTNGVYVSGYPVAVSITSQNDKLHSIENNIISDFNQYGIYLQYSDNDAVRYNTINNVASGGSPITTGSVIGIFYNGPTTASNNNWECRGNNVNLNAAGSGTSAFGIYTQIRGTGTSTILYDTVQLTASGTSSQLIGIVGQNNDGNLNIFQNVIQNFTTPATNTNHVIGIMNGYNTVNIYPANSQITFNTIKNFNVTSGSSYIVAGCVDHNGIAAPMTFSNNTITGFTISGNCNSFRGYSNQVVSSAITLSQTINNNVISNITATGTTTPFFGFLLQTSYNTTSTATNNKIRDINFGTGAVLGMQVDYGIKSTLSFDTFTNMKGGGDIYAIKAGYTNVAVGNLQFNDNLIDSFSSTGTSNIVAGIGIAPGTSVYLTTAGNIYNNRIFELSSTGTGATAYGLTITGGSATYNIYNNMLFDIAAKSNTTAYSSSFGVNLMAAGTNNVYYNTVNLASSANSGYGATGLIFNAGGANTFRNNILRVNVTAGSTNNVAAMRNNSGSPSSSPSSTAFTASNNIYYTPTGANNYLYVEGTASLVNGFNLSGLTANTTTNIVNDIYFNSTCGQSKYRKFMTAAMPKREDGTYTENNLVAASSAPITLYIPSGLSFAESGAGTTPIATDIDGIVRTIGDIGAAQFSGKQIPAFEVKVTSSSSIDTACKDNLPTLSANVNSYYTSVTYQWYKDTSIITGATSSSYKIDALGGNYIVKAYDAVTGCTVASQPYNIFMMPPPPAIITYYDSLVFCETSSIVLTANSGKGYTYQWYKNGIPIAGSTLIGNVVDQTGTYTVEVNTPLGCPTLSAPIAVKVYPLPKPVIQISAMGPKVLETTHKYYTYRWYFYNVPIPDSAGGNGIRFYAKADGPYSVQVTDTNGCTNKSSVYLYSVGIDDPSIAEATKVYPNPTSGLVNINAPIAVNISVKDITGRIVMEKENAREINLSGYAEGLYIMTISDKEGRLIKLEKITKTE